MKRKIKYTIQISSKAKRDFKKLDYKVQKKISQAILSLEKNVAPQQFKPLIGHEVAEYRMRVGDFRILYDVYEEDGVVLILRIGHRKDIYR